MALTQKKKQENARQNSKKEVEKDENCGSLPEVDHNDSLIEVPDGEAGFDDFFEGFEGGAN